MMNKRCLCLPVFLLCAVASAGAAAADWYLGGSIGLSQIDVSASEVEEAFLVDDDFVATDTSLDEADFGWKAFVGYHLLPVLSLEAGYIDLGKATFDTTITEAPPPFDGITPFSIRGMATADGPQLSAVAHLPLTPRFRVLGRVGMFRWDAEFRERIPDTGTTRLERSEHGIDLVYGLGAQLDITRALAARLEWERLEGVGEGIGGRAGRDVDFFSVGLTIGF